VNIKTKVIIELLKRGRARIILEMTEDKYGFQKTKILDGGFPWEATHDRVFDALKELMDALRNEVEDFELMISELTALDAEVEIRKLEEEE